MNFNPSSLDSVLSTILSRLDAQDQAAAAWRIQTTETVNAMLSEAKKTNGRVTGLERLRDVTQGKLVVIMSVAGIASGGLGSLLTLGIQHWIDVKP